jgi:type I restriction enzyme S subunit
LFIRAQNINTDRLCFDDIAHVLPPDSAEGRRTRVKRGDILITITGANVTKTALVEEEIEESYISQHVALVRLIAPDNAPFLYLWTISPVHGRAKLVEDAYGAGKPGLNLDNIREMDVVLPSPDEQREIVRRVEALFQRADEIERVVKLAAHRADRMTQSVLAKAFRGDLVPTEADLARREHRTYEPASELLTRIRESMGERSCSRQRKANDCGHNI